MFIVNQYGVIHEIPDDRPAPKGSRPATEQEIRAWREADAKNKKVIASDKQARKVANAGFVIHTGDRPDADLTDEDRQNLGAYRADPANPNQPYEDPKPVHSPRPNVYPPTGEPYNPLTGLPDRVSGKIRPENIPPDVKTAGIPYDPATGDYLRVTPASPLDPTIEPPQGQPGGRPIGADVDAEVVPGEPVKVVTTAGKSATITTQEGGSGVVATSDVNWNSQAQEQAAKDAPQGKPQGKGEGSKTPPAKKA